MHICMCVCLGEASTCDVAPVFSFLTGKSADSGAGPILVLWPCDLGLNPTLLFAVYEVWLLGAIPDSFLHA